MLEPSTGTFTREKCRGMHGHGIDDVIPQVVLSIADNDNCDSDYEEFVRAPTVKYHAQTITGNASVTVDECDGLARCFGFADVASWRKTADSECSARDDYLLPLTFNAFPRAAFASVEKHTPSTRALNADTEEKEFSSDEKDDDSDHDDEAECEDSAEILQIIHQLQGEGLTSSGFAIESMTNNTCMCRTTSASLPLHVWSGDNRREMDTFRQHTKMMRDLEQSFLKPSVSGKSLAEAMKNPLNGLSRVISQRDKFCRTWLGVHRILVIERGVELMCGRATRQEFHRVWEVRRLFAMLDEDAR